MANKALATRQRMQFRVEPAQMPAHVKKRRGTYTVAVFTRQKSISQSIPKTILAATPMTTNSLSCASDVADNESKHDRNDDV